MKGIKEEFLRLLKEDEEFRYAVAGYLGLQEILRRIDANTEAIRSLQEQVRENSRIIEEHSKIIQEHSRAIREHSKVIREHSRVIREHSRVIEELTRSVQALGARWGILAESAFREGMRGVVERFFGGRVERWTYYDEEGEVFGHPSVVEVDLLIRDEEHILLEIKSSISRGDVYELWKISKIYERKTGVKPKLAIISPYVDEKAVELSRKLGINTYTSIPS